MKLTDAQMLRAFEALGMQFSELHAVRAPGSLPDMQARLAEFQARLKKSFRVAALRLHPDHNPDDPEAEDTFKLVLEVVRQLQALSIRERPRPRPRMYYTGTGSTTTTGTWGGSGTIRINIKVK